MVATRTKTYASVADTVRTSRKSLLQEAADIGASFDEQNDPTIFTAEGELREGSLPAVDQHALSVDEGGEDEEIKEELLTESDSEVGEDIATSSDESDLTRDFRSADSIDWEEGQQGFVVPRITAKKEYQWCIPRKLDTEYKFFPDEDQLGPIPDEWLKDVGEDLQKAIYDSLSEGEKKAINRANSMAVIVEVPEKTEKAGKSKGKDIDAGERSAGFAEYLRQMHVKIEEEESMPKKGRSKKTSSKQNAEKKKFMRPDSQIPNGGWFRATTSASGSPSAPPNSPSIPSSGSDDSSSESSSSSSDDTGSDSSDSDSSDDNKKRQEKEEKRG
ncbi:hypothetical protein R3P38DRAFT_3531541 [Favolaschia claudopus]|uniref:Uncharacterized protein n=1 Tax=Favolaschia claudopus TaxID=2862362 RepID=A0AAW0BHJ4_9AGAR